MSQRHSSWQAQVASLEHRMVQMEKRVDLLLAYISPADEASSQVENIGILTPEEATSLIRQLGVGSQDYRKHQTSTMMLPSGKVIIIDAAGRTRCYATRQDMVMAEERSQSQSQRPCTNQTSPAAPPGSGEQRADYWHPPSWQAPSNQSGARANAWQASSQESNYQPPEMSKQW
jgi:hypothetical protein